MRYGILTVLLLISSLSKVFATDVVVLLSIDGLRSDAISTAQAHLPSFQRLFNEGATTLNARTDVDVTVTLPNHTSMLTSRPVNGVFGHHVRINDLDRRTVHQLRGSYVQSVFDVLRQHGLISSMIATKNKFDLFKRSFPIDKVFIATQGDGDAVRIFLDQLRTSKTNFYFVHLAGMDVVGHRDGWSTESASTYIKELKNIDAYVGQIMEALDDLNSKGARAVLILTTDHGGLGKSHSNSLEPKNYIIPFIIWGKDIAAGVNLYKINRYIRLEPADQQIAYSQSLQPIRNGEAGNLVLHLFSLPCINGSSIGCQPALNIQEH